LIICIPVFGQIDDFKDTNNRWLAQISSSDDGRIWRNTQSIPPNTIRYDFDTFEDWKYMHQDTATIEQYRLSEGNLLLTTRAHTYDRTKVNLTAAKLKTGRSSCRVYIPTMYSFDQTSIASFLYCDDRHEIDFEIGYGSAEKRAESKSQKNEVLCYMTSQGFPFQSEIVNLKMNKWYVIDIDISMKNGKYFIQWFINGKLNSSLQTKFGEEKEFRVVLSLENLKFLGDHISNNNYEIKFDWLDITHYN
jgi:hypothetical protein